MSIAIGTSIAIPGGVQAIEALPLSATIIGYDEATKQTVPAVLAETSTIGLIGGQTVLSASGSTTYMRSPRTDMQNITFSDGTVLGITPEHQILTTAGWCSLNPGYTLMEHPTAQADYLAPGNPLGILAVGDSVVNLAGNTVTIQSITPVAGAVATAFLRRILGSYVYFANGIPIMSWSKADAAPTATLGPKESDYVAAAQALLDTTAQTRNYDDMHSLVSYLNSTNATFKAEAEAGNAWRDAVWDTGNSIMAQVQNGTMAAPTVAAFLAMLPTFTWPS